jgi:hypothetical protein
MRRGKLHRTRQAIKAEEMTLEDARAQAATLLLHLAKTMGMAINKTPVEIANLPYGEVMRFYMNLAGAELLLEGRPDNGK